MKFCYFGISDPNFGRNKVYISGLRALGHEVVECFDTTPGLRKYGRLKRKHAAIMAAGGYDVMIVGYPGHLVVPFAKRISPKPVIFDALCTLYEGEILSRGKYRTNPFMRWRVNYIDEKAMMCADRILVETDAQKEFILKRFALDTDKVARVFTGVDDSVFTYTANPKKREKFTVVFRGKFLPEAGVKYIITAAKLLERAGVQFLICGHGFLQEQVRQQIEREKLSNIEWISDFLTLEELAAKMRECHVSLGQFEQHDRLSRTIPHKAFESLALGLPYVTARAAGISELLTDRETCLMTEPGNPEDIAEKILELKNSPALAQKIAAAGRALYESQLTPQKLAQEIVTLAGTVSPRT